MNGEFGQWFMDGGHFLVGLALILFSTSVHLAFVKERNWRLAVELLLMYSMGVSGFKGIFLPQKSNPIMTLPIIEWPSIHLAEPIHHLSHNVYTRLAHNSE